MTGRRHRIAAAVTLSAVLLGLVLVGDGGAYTAGGPWHAGSRVSLLRPDGWWSCTLGPQTYLPDNTVGQFVAKHCVDRAMSHARVEDRWADTFGPADITWSNVTDVALVHIGGQGTAAASAEIRLNAGTARVGGYQRHIYPGQTLCFHGAKTGDSCGVVEEQIPQPSWTGPEGAARMWVLRVTWGPWSQNGNSGAPVFDPNWGLVAGILSGALYGPETGSKIFFYDIATMEWAMGYPAGSLRPVV